LLLIIYTISGRLAAVGPLIVNFFRKLEAFPHPFSTVEFKLFFHGMCPEFKNFPVEKRREHEGQALSLASISKKN
jgi:hypothetical protein